MKKLVSILVVVFAFLACTLHADAYGSWKKDGKGWWYDNGNGTYEKETFTLIDGKTYYFDENGYMGTGWHLRPHSDDLGYYYFRKSGELASCEWVEGNKWISYFGWLERSRWVDNYRYYVNDEGVWEPSKGTRKTAWKKDGKGWWFDLGDGTYANDGFYEIDRNLYYFDESGYMKTGWVKVSDWWYYFGSDGAMRHNTWVGGYYLLDTGRMAESTWIDRQSTYIDKNGHKAPGWQKDSKGWWFSLGADGYLSKWWYFIGGYTYLFDDDGYMVTGWDYRYGNWYYYNKDGSQKQNAWEGDYWLDENGHMATNSWVDGGKYYVGADGKWVPGA